MKNAVIDLDDVLERVQDDWELLLELLDIFTQDFKEKRVVLAEALAQKNCDKIRDVGHSLKGASGNISAKPLFQTFYKLEKMGEGKNLEGMDELLALLDSQFIEFSECAAKLKKDYQSR